MLSFFYISLLLLSQSVNAKFEVPKVLFACFEGGGFQAAINIGENNIKEFQFASEVGNSNQIKKTVNETEDNYLIYKNDAILLKINDTIKYNYLVKNNNLGYLKIEQNYTVHELVKKKSFNFPPNRIVPKKELSKFTVVNGERVNVGQVIFEDSFQKSQIDASKWLVENELPSQDEENEFVMYDSSRVSTENEKLIISLSKNRKKFLDITSCTNEDNTFCFYQKATYTDIAPPLKSGRINTKKTFSFKYGNVTIRAKMPKGDWIYPQIYLKPKKKNISGLMKIAFTRGNTNLIKDAINIGNQVLYGAIRFDFNESNACKVKEVSTKKLFNWGDEYHIYTMIWTKDVLEWYVDHEHFGKISKTVLTSECENSSLFDQEFYLSIGLAVGGMTEFNLVKTPWEEDNPKTSFSRSEVWKNWQDGKENMMVDYIRVTAI